MTEIRSGVYVGNFSKRIREEIWGQVTQGIEEGDGVLVWSERNDQGYSFRTCGQNRRVPVELDGLTLVRIFPNDCD